MIRLIGWVLCVVIAAPVLAETEPSPVPWSQLNQQEQETLHRFSDRWDQLPPERQQRLLNGARLWSNMDQEERQQARQRFHEWRQLPQDQQQHLRQRYERFRQLPPEKQEAIRKARQWFRSLPQERRQAMREQWKNMSPAERHEMRRQLRKEYLEQHPNQGGNEPLYQPPNRGAP